MTITTANRRNPDAGLTVGKEIARRQSVHDLEPIAPRDALELYLTDRRGDLSDWTIRSHRSRLSTFIDWCVEDEGIENMNALTGRTVHRHKIWRRDEGDINTVTLKTQISKIYETHSYFIGNSYLDMSELAAINFERECITLAIYLSGGFQK